MKVMVLERNLGGGGGGGGGLGVVVVVVVGVRGCQGEWEDGV